MLETSFATKKALIIESYKVFRDLIKNATASLGIGQVDSVRNSYDAIKNCKEHDYDIIYLGYDLGEGKKNGQQTLEELRVNGLIKRTCTVLMITAESSQEMVLCAMEHKPDTYLTKPFTTKELLRRLLQTMDKKAELAQIYLALDHQSAELVLTLCDAKIKEKNRYLHDCLAIKSKQLFELGEFAATEEICVQYINVENCFWAAIGLGKVYMQYRCFDKATNVFKKLLADNPLYIPGFEWLAKNYKAQGDFELAKITLEKAIETSPRSLSLMQEYAYICEQNTDYDKAINAFKKSLSLSKNSVHHTPDKGLEYVRAVFDYSDPKDTITLDNHTKSAMRELSNIDRDFKSTENNILTSLASACLSYTNKDKLNASKQLEVAQSLCKSLGDNLTGEIELELAKAYSHLNMEEKSNLLLLSIVERFEEQACVMLQVDQFVIEPLSKHGKQVTEDAKQLGVNYYNNHNYQDAITDLSAILNIYPNHVSIKLTLIEALIKAYQENETQINYLTRASKLLLQLEKVPRDNENFQQLLSVKKKVMALNKMKKGKE
ncbi:response regulator [Pseudoalteromonas sp. C2R02]|uniref:response regulator n=1 Tax=Pseudoalteromonas sp. C2R02 TaxID=2841565 RepID=UPI001C097658|nr:response regulator [Pseudoalteromonas sp. C2R02]MBU2970208.1 response regulator [Pseudoalteromonas sp. C2R02]